VFHIRHKLLALVGLLALASTACTVHTGHPGVTSSSSVRTGGTRASTGRAGDAGSASADPMVVAAGDITSLRCTYCADVDTAALIERMDPTTVLALGDNQYPSGRLNDFRSGYDHTWGLFKRKTRPVPGDHEYLTPGAPGYFGYFGRAARPAGVSYYSYNLGGWHLVALDSNLARDRGSAQERWLRSDLSATGRQCILAYWHVPRFSSSSRRGGDSSVGAFWTDLYAAGADVVLNGHWHLYERFAPQAPSGAVDSRRGIRQFVVGTGGAPLHRSPATALAASRKLVANVHGVLRLELRADSYGWQFIDVDGSVRDSGGQACH
jgi:hypothetical protein